MNQSSTLESSVATAPAVASAPSGAPAKQDPYQRILDLENQRAAALAEMKRLDEQAAKVRESVKQIDTEAAAAMRASRHAILSGLPSKLGVATYRDVIDLITELFVKPQTVTLTRRPATKTQTVVRRQTRRTASTASSGAKVHKARPHKGNASKGRRVSPEVKTEIVNALRKGSSVPSIARLTGLSDATLNSYKAKANLTGRKRGVGAKGRVDVTTIPGINLDLLRSAA